MADITSNENKHAINGQWLVEYTSSDIGFVRSIMIFNTTDTVSFEAFTRKNADRDIFGFWKSVLARTFSSSFKHGSFIRIENGKMSDSLGVLNLKGIFSSPMGRYYFNGVLKDGILTAELTNKKKEIKGKFVAVKNSPKLPLSDYPNIVEEAISVTKKNIYSHQVIQSSEWKIFEHKIKKVSVKIQDDLELVIAFFYYSGKLPFSHYALVKEIPEEPEKSIKKDKKKIFFNEINNATAYLNITSFDGTTQEMDSAFYLVKDKKYKNLIIDLRQNGGGSIEAGMRFASHLTDSSFFGGIFLTREYFNKNIKIPHVDEYSKFPHFTEASYDLLMKELHQKEALCLKVIPDHNPYKGQVFVLTSGITASTCEPLVYGLKYYKKAIIVGETTAGKMLSAEAFNISAGFQIWLPISDYYTVDGYQIDQKGVLPNIKVKSTDALNYVINNLLK